MSSLKELEERQKRMYQLIDQMMAEEDLSKMLGIVQELEAEGKLLEAAGKAFQEKMAKEHGPPKPRPKFDVVLTPDQRERIFKATGVQMETVQIDDSSGNLMRAMPYIEPPLIEQMALMKAKSMKGEKEARAAAKQEVGKVIADLEQHENPLIRGQVEQLLKDPDFRKTMMLDEK